jgi:hypothetical protein
MHAGEVLNAARGDPSSPHALSTQTASPRSQRAGDAHAVSGQLAALVRRWGASKPEPPAYTNATRELESTSSSVKPDWAEPEFNEADRGERQAPRGATATTPAQRDELLAAAVGRVLTSELRRYGIEVDEP